jgi:DNA-binding SARP family transcriptional activator/tetratricopeptide (TPR) repeat protein
MEPDGNADRVRHAAWLVSTGAAATVVATVAALPADELNPMLAAVHAEALYCIGAVDEGMAAFERLAAAPGPLPAGLGWRYGLVRYLCGDPSGALEILRRAEPGGAPAQDRALLLAWTAAVSWANGAAACHDLAERAGRAARELDDQRCIAASHVALGLSAQLRGDRPAVQAHHDRALRAAEACGDVFTAVRVRTNRSAILLHEARYPQALAAVRPAVALADTVGYPSLLAPAVHNEATALSGLGRLHEASRCFQRAIDVYQGMGSDKVVYALTGLGDVHRLRRRASQARAAYEEALRIGGGGAAIRTAALAGLARVLAEAEPGRAAGLAAEALAAAPPPLLALASIAAGRVAAAAARDADRSSAAWATVRGLAAAAAAAAREHRAVADLADALELAGEAAVEPGAARQAFAEALAIWTDAGAVLDADRVRLAMATTTGRPPDWVQAAMAADRLAAAGVVGPIGAEEPEPVRIAALGRFAVTVGDKVLPPGAWQSRKARDLLRILVARRGRPVARDELAELLWPGEPLDRVGHRLAVALSTTRAVLDPGRRLPTEHHIGGDGTSVALNLGPVVLDAATFAGYAQAGLAALRGGEPDQARPALEAAERAYTGDFLEDEPYDDIGTDAREELRAIFLQVTRALAGQAEAAGQADDAVRYLLRILAADRYDERAHDALVRVLDAHGRHGEARRARARRAAIRAELGVALTRI